MNCFRNIIVVFRRPGSLRCFEKVRLSELISSRPVLSEILALFLMWRESFKAIVWHFVYGLERLLRVPPLISIYPMLDICNRLYADNHIL